MGNTCLTPFCFWLRSSQRNEELTKQNLQLRNKAERKAKEAQVLNRHLVNSQAKIKEMADQLEGLQTSEARRRINKLTTKPPVSTNIKTLSKVKELTAEVGQLKKDLETSQFKATEAEVRDTRWRLLKHYNT